MTPDAFGLNPAYEDLSGERGGDPRTLTKTRAVDDAALAGYLLFSHVPSPLTIFSDVRRIASIPSSLKRDVSEATQLRAHGEMQLRKRLRAAVRARLPAKIEPVGVFLSGGLDSSLIAALLVEAGVEVIAFTLDFGQSVAGELEFARAVAAFLKIPLYTVPCGPREVARAWEATVKAMAQPYGDPVCVPLWLLGKAARDVVGTVFNGEGGDQLFGGWANKPLVAAAAYGETDLYAAYRATYHRFDGQLAALWPGHPDVSIDDWLAVGLEALPEAPLLHRLRAANIALKGAQNIAPRCAALARCHGLTVRAPFFDDALAAFTFTLPPEAFLSGACEKAILKDTARGLLPDEIIFREKRGMGVPSAEWCLPRFGPVGRRVRSLLSRRRIRGEGRFDPNVVGELLSGRDASPAGFRRRRVGEKLWTLSTWELWREVHSL